MKTLTVHPHAHKLISPDRRTCLPSPRPPLTETAGSASEPPGSVISAIVFVVIDHLMGLSGLSEPKEHGDGAFSKRNVEGECSAGVLQARRSKYTTTKSQNRSGLVSGSHQLRIKVDFKVREMNHCRKSPIDLCPSYEVF